MPKKGVNKKQDEKDLANERWLKVEELIKHGDIKDSADFMDQVNAIMSVKDHKRSSFVIQNTSINASGFLEKEIYTVAFGRSKVGQRILPGDQDYEAMISNDPYDNSTLNIRLLYKELAEHPRAVWRCISYDGVTMINNF